MTPLQAIHVLDFEGSLQSGVLEAGIVHYEAGEILECFSQEYRPHGSIHPQETAIHGLTEDRLIENSLFTDQFETFQSFRQTGIWAAHHAPTEDSFLRRAWPYPGRISSIIEETPITTYEWGPWIDTHILYQRLYKKLPSYQLMDLVALFNCQEELATIARMTCPKHRLHPHAALFDAIGTALLLKRLVVDFGPMAHTITWLLEHSLKRETFANLFLQKELPLS